ncbi:hypothetical protein HID58_075864 [Brassica napus]|uniref:Uncharacterized protein n=1 Tax=Brassica napus TaxID=3708 RepID=A0ABQ7YML4_BRANA|nr:hypothetical protein HID58_075864 [Brassica napus]
MSYRRSRASCVGLDVVTCKSSASKNEIFSELEPLDRSGGLDGDDPARSDFNGGRQRWQSGEVVRLSFPVRLPMTSFLVTVCVASISAVRVWFFGPGPVVLASFYSAGSGGCSGSIINSSLQIRAVIGLVVGVLVVPVGDFGLLEYPGASELQEGGVEVAVCGDWWLVLRQALVVGLCGKAIFWRRVPGKAIYTGS